MPDITKYNDKDEWMSDCIKLAIESEGKTQEQAVAMCSNWWDSQKGTNNMLNKLTFQVNTDSNLVRMDTMEGKDWTVVPMIMITEGVHNGSNGPLYYPAEELKKIPDVWNHKPIVLYHPEVNGKGVSACSPEILSSRKLGIIMNTKFEDGKLKAEAWIDKNRANEVDERVMEAVDNGEMLEVSTGVFTSNEYTEGEWNGEKYIAIAREYKPDHLAILPDLVGACSIEDGAGFLRLNSQRNLSKNWADDIFPMLKAAGIDTDKLYPADNKKSLGRKIEQVRKALDEEMKNQTNEPEEYPFVVEVYDDFVVYEMGTELYKRDYKIEDDDVVFTEDPEQVFRVVEYRNAQGETVTNINNNNLMKGNKMKKEEMVKKVIENENVQFTEDDKEFLNNQDEATLQKMLPVDNKDNGKPEPDNKDNDTKPAEPSDNKDGDTKADNKTKDDSKAAEPAMNKAQTAEEYIANAPKEVQEVLKNGLNSYNAEKQRCIKAITANEKNAFTEDQLKNKGLQELKALVQLARKEEEDEEPTPNYLGAGDPLNNDDVTDNADEEPLEVPALNFGGDGD